MQSRRNAVLIALAFSFVPLLGWVADIIMGLVTLRHGAREGAFVLIAAMVPGLLLALKGYPQFLSYNILAGSVLIYVLALVLRSTGAWAYVLQTAVMVGVIEIVAIHIVLPTLGADWSNQALGYFANLRQQLTAQISNSGVQHWAVIAGKIVIGIQFTFLMLYNLVILVLARFLQAKLYNPQGLQPELHNIRLSAVSVFLFLAAVLGSFSGVEAAFDSLVLTLLPFIVAGLSLIHYVALLTKVNSFWFIGFYGLFILFLPYCAILLAILALLDSGFNFRERIKAKYR